MKKERVSLSQILDPKHKFNLTLYTESGTVTFNSLTVTQLASLLYPYVRKFRLKNGELDGTQATLIFEGRKKRFYVTIEII
ncbi:hypothetical protein [Sulfurisphaera ohwakuensis]|uniref:hypothetical protein n=1 Tax=Sulfurisphaera ohwakuensis TaxID=69656 RepID=UPI0036F19980